MRGTDGSFWVLMGDVDFTGTAERGKGVSLWVLMGDVGATDTAGRGGSTSGRDNSPYIAAGEPLIEQGALRVRAGEEDGHEVHLVVQEVHDGHLDTIWGGVGHEIGRDIVAQEVHDGHLALLAVVAREQVFNWRREEFGGEGTVAVRGTRSLALP